MSLHTAPTLTELFDKLERNNDNDEWFLRPAFTCLIMRDDTEGFLAYTNHRREKSTFPKSVYLQGQKLALDFPNRFEALIQAAYRQGDTLNQEKIKAMFPEIVNDLMLRYNAPGGDLPGDDE